MVLDITDLDKIKVLQALYACAEPRGYGRATYKIKNTEGLSIQECEEIFYQGAEKSWSDKGHCLPLPHSMSCRHP